MFLPHPPALSGTSAPSSVPVFLSSTVAVDVLKHEVIFSVVRLAATCIICLGFLLLLLPEEWDSVTLRFLSNITDKKSEENGEELTESSVNTRSRSRANGAVSIPLAWHGRALLVASVNQPWSPHVLLLPTQEVWRDVQSSWTLSGRQEVLSWTLDGDGDVSVSLPLHCRRGNQEHLWILQIERVEVIYFLEILATLSPVPRTYPNQELSVLPWLALRTVFCEYKYWQGQFGSILYVFMIFI